MTYLEWLRTQFKYDGTIGGLERSLQDCWDAAIASTKAQEKPVAALLQKPVETLNIKDVDIPS